MESDEGWAQPEEASEYREDGYGGLFIDDNHNESMPCQSEHLLRANSLGRVHVNVMTVAMYFSCAKQCPNSLMNSLTNRCSYT